ncbi:hypothetical protein [Afifella pfennigii]|uniref:hypothetical protein n=1 Tax=Afifella pfennigii TaxID=209897 RepID=UPI00047ED4E0|nr:hypothetical protein [Afifella pfennigii]
MSATDTRKRRLVRARRTLALGTAAATVAGSLVQAQPAEIPSIGADNQVLLAQTATGGEGEGEGEGEGARLDPTVVLLRDLGFIEGHLRAGMALYEAGDREAARTHMGHPIEEKYDAVAQPLEERALERLRSEILALAKASEADAPFAELEPLFAAVRATIEEARGQTTAREQIKGLAELTRIAGAEYQIGLEGGTVSNLHEYQDAWGFLRVVETEARQMAESDDPEIAEAGTRILGHLAATDATFGDLQGQGDFEVDPSRLFGAAARIDIVALRIE